MISTKELFVSFTEFLESSSGNSVEAYGQYIISKQPSSIFLQMLLLACGSLQSLSNCSGIAVRHFAVKKDFLVLLSPVTVSIHFVITHASEN